MDSQSEQPPPWATLGASSAAGLVAAAAVGGPAGRAGLLQGVPPPSAPTLVAPGPSASPSSRSAVGGGAR
eukprot:5249699-Lingulodinium_polyedra.AAC.1